MSYMVNSSLDPIGGGGGAARYWKLTFDRSGFDGATVMDGSVISSIYEIEVAETVGGADISSSATPTMPVGYYGGSPASLTDNNLSTYASWLGNPTAELLLDFGAGNAKNIREVRARSENGLNPPSRFTVSASPDNISWTPRWDGEWLWMRIPAILSFSVDPAALDFTGGGHTTWDIGFTDGASPGFIMAMYELDLLDLAGTVLTPASYADWYAGLSTAGAVENLFDDDTATYIGPSTPPPDLHVYCKFRTPQVVRQVRINPNAPFGPKDFYVRCRNERETSWTTVYSKTDGVAVSSLTTFSW